MRTCYCGQVDKKIINHEIKLCGWINRIRNHGKVIFINLRDREGIVQIVIEDENKELFNNTFENININKFFFTIGAPNYKLLYFFNFLCTMSIDKKLLNIMPIDLIILRNLLLDYILIYFKLDTTINKNIINENIINEFKNLNYNDNFLCYDEININNKIIYDKINIYSSFYFIKTNNNNFDIDSKYNFDDKFIIDFKLSILF